MKTKVKPKITIFHCINAFSELASLSLTRGNGFDLRSVKLPCSSMVKGVYLLRAFEAGSDAVIVLVCPEGECRQVNGNLRARKRVERVRKILDEIGIDDRRLLLFNITPGDGEATADIIRKALENLTAPIPVLLRSPAV
jgi:F420-non-reducing hydrogenase iron-sulfur subunit